RRLLTGSAEHVLGVHRHHLRLRHWPEPGAARMTASAAVGNRGGGSCSWTGNGELSVHGDLIRPVLYRPGEDVLADGLVGGAAVGGPARRLLGPGPGGHPGGAPLHG